MCENCNKPILGTVSLEGYVEDFEFNNVDNIQFTSTNYLTNESTIMDFESDGSIEQMIKKFRAFLLAQTFGEALIDEWIVDPYGLY